MIPLIATLVLLASAQEPPLWVGHLLQNSPPTSAPQPPNLPAPPPLPPTAETRYIEHRLGVGFPGPDDGPANYPALVKKIDSLVERGEYDAAYQAALAGYPSDRVDSYSDRLIGAVLVSGHYAYLERLLVRYVRDGGESLGTYSLNYDQLSYATAMQGRIYEGQGEYALASLQAALERTPLPARLKAGQAPTTAKDVAFTNLLTLGLGMGMGGLYGRLYLERALGQRPACEIAGWSLFMDYEGMGRLDDATRIARIMVANLEPGPTRDRLQDWLDRP